MSATAEVTAAGAGAGVVGPSARSRLYGFGSVFAKGLRESRRAVVGVALFVSLLAFFVASALVSEWPTLEARLAFAGGLSALPAVVRGLLGEPIALETLGGFLSWRSLNFMPVLIGLWSVLALSGTLAGEATRGSLEFVVAAPFGRRRIAAEKVLVHLAGLTLAMTVSALATWFAGAVLGTLPGDRIALADALAQFLLIGLASLVAGAIAFAAAPFVGRGQAAGIGALALFGSYVVNGYAGIVVGFETLKPLSWFAWTAGHRPLAGRYDWPSVALLAAVCLVLLAVGVVAFERRDVGRTVHLAPPLPRLAYGLRGPLGRAFADRLPGALSWGIAIGLYGWLIAISSDAFAEMVRSVPGLSQFMSRFLPGLDYTSAAGILQLAFFALGLLVVGLAAATLVAGWASDEQERRLEVVLSAPLGRFRWALASGGAVLLALALLAAPLAAGVAVGAAAMGDDPLPPVEGSAVMGLYAAALAGVGLAAGGLFRAGLAAPLTGGLAVAFFLLDFLGESLNLPDEVIDLALSRHLGRPMAGSFDPAGIAACLILAVGGLAVSAWGYRRRDLAL